MKTAVYMVTHDDPDTACRVIKILHRTSECDFDLFVVDSGSGPIMQRRLSELATQGKIKSLTLMDENVGQNIGANVALEKILERNEYEWVVCWSPDVIPKSKRALKKLVRAAQMFRIAGVNVVASPKIRGGEPPVHLTATGDDVGFPYYEAEVLKGYARCVHRDFYAGGWRLNSYNAISHGEAAEYKDRAEELRWPCVVVENIIAKHRDSGEDTFFTDHVGYGL